MITIKRMEDGSVQLRQADDSGPPTDEQLKELADLFVQRRLSVFMRNITNTADIKLPFDIVVSDRTTFERWYRETVGVRANLATYGDVRLPSINEMTDEWARDVRYAGWEDE